jgi:hypothetical protein
MRSSVAVASEVGARAIPRAPVRVTPRIRPLRRLDPGRKRSHREGQVGAALALVVVLGALVVPAAEAGVRWDGARFERQEELCVWLRAHRSRCDVWAIHHPTAWQSLAGTAKPQARPAQPSLGRVPRAIRTSGPTQAALGALAGMALILSLAPLPMALRRRMGSRTLEIRIGLATFACAVGAGLVLASA